MMVFELVRRRRREVTAAHTGSVESYTGRLKDISTKKTEESNKQRSACIHVAKL
jgi:hypothetical protein